MRQTLMRIPLDADWSLGFLGQVPGFGFGLVLLLWILVGVTWLYRHRRNLRGAEVLLPGVTWLLIAWVIVQLPAWVQTSPRNLIAEHAAEIEQHVASPQLVDHYLARGQAHQAVYEYQQAAEDYQAAINLDPNRDAGYLALAWLRATCPEAEFRDGSQSVELAQTAFELARPKTAVNYDTLAAAYAEAGRFEEALRVVRTASIRADHSTNPLVRERLPDIRARLEQYRDEQPHRAPRFAQTFPQSLPVRGYGFMMFLGFLAAGLTATRLAKRVGIGPDVIWDVGIWTLLGGIAGGRLFYLVQYHERVFEGKTGLDLLLVPFQLQEGGLVLLGGVLLGSAVFIGYCVVRGLKPLLMADVAIPAFFVALAFGRLGCLMNGCCYGDRCELPWAIQFPLGSVPDMALVLRGFVPADSPWGLPLHPSQIYSSLNALILGLLTITYFRYRNRDGAVLAVGWLTYPITRFLIEFLRGDEMGQLGTGFTISQLTSAGLFVTGVLFTLWLSQQPPVVTVGVADSETN